MKFLKLARYKALGKIDNQDALKISKMYLGKLKDLHLEKGLEFTSFLSQESSKDKAFLYKGAHKLVGIGAKDQTRVRLKFGVTLFV